MFLCRGGLEYLDSYDHVQYLHLTKISHSPSDLCYTFFEAGRPVPACWATPSCLVHCTTVLDDKPAKAPFHLIYLLHVSPSHTHTIVMLSFSSKPMLERTSTLSAHVSLASAVERSGRVIDGVWTIGDMMDILIRCCIAYNEVYGLIVPTFL